MEIIPAELVGATIPVLAVRIDEAFALTGGVLAYTGIRVTGIGRTVDAVIAVLQSAVASPSGADVIEGAGLSVVAGVGVIAWDASAFTVALVVGAWIAVVGAGGARRIEAAVRFFIATVGAFSAFRARIAGMDAAGSLAAGVCAVAE